MAYGLVGASVAIRMQWVFGYQCVEQANYKIGKAQQKYKPSRGLRIALLADQTRLSAQSEVLVQQPWAP